MATENQNADDPGMTSFADFEAKIAEEEAKKTPEAAEDVTPRNIREVMEPVGDDEGGDDVDDDDVDDDGDDEDEDDDEGGDADERGTEENPDDDDEVVVEEDEETRAKKDDELTDEQRANRRSARMRSRYAKRGEDLAAAKERAAELERQLAEAKAAKPVEQQQQQKPLKATVADDPNDPAPKADDYEFGELDSQYITDMAAHAGRAAYRAEKAKDAQAAEAAAADEARKTVRGKFMKLVAKGVEGKDDFEDVVVKAAENYKLTRDTFDLIVDSKVGHEVLYHLATHKDEAARIAGLTPAQQGVEFFKLEARFSTPNDKNDPPAGAKSGTKGTKAPAPVKRARGSGKPKVNPAKMDFASFEAAMAAEEAAKRKG